MSYVALSAAVPSFLWWFGAAAVLAVWWFGLGWAAAVVLAVLVTFFAVLSLGWWFALASTAVVLAVWWFGLAWVAAVVLAVFTIGLALAGVSTMPNRIWGEGAPWQVNVLSEASALKERLGQTRAWYASLQPKPQTEPLNDLEQFRAITSAIDRDLNEARKAAEKPKRLGEAITSWWNGSSIETSWAALHRATQNLLLVGSPSYVRAQFPDMEWQVRATFDDADTRKKQYLAALQEESEKHDDNRLDRERLVNVRRIRDQVWDTAYADLRRFRNILLVLTVAIAVLVCGFVVLDLSPGLVPVCSGTPDQGTICPSGADVAGWRDALTIATAGAVGGLVAATTSLRRVDRSRGPYNVAVAQAVLKVPFGAATAIFGTVLVANQVLGISVTPGTGQLVAYAILFGYAQQAFTRNVETRANTLLAATPGSQPPQASSDT